MLKLNMVFDTVILANESVFYMQDERNENKDIWLKGICAPPFTATACTKEEVLSEIQKPFVMIQYSHEGKSVKIFRDVPKKEEVSDAKKTLVSLAMLGEIYSANK